LDSYLTISEKTIGEGYYTDKRSKFLAFAHHVESVEEAMDIIASTRKKYYDARHCCYAYMIGAEREEFRANDDGEPSSTAGKPILGQINSTDLTNILICVVRYFGGVKLGTSGLIVAYRTAAADAIAHAEIEERLIEEHLSVYLSDDEWCDAYRERDAATNRGPAFRQRLLYHPCHQKEQGRGAAIEIGPSCFRMNEILMGGCGSPMTARCTA